jgi:hypothetical protein
MNLKLLIGIWTVFVISGCVSSMPDNYYRQYSAFSGYLQKCFEDEYLSPQLYADTKNAMSYTLRTWSYDRDKISSMHNEVYSNAYTNAERCREVEAHAYQMIGNVRQHRDDQKDSKEEWNNALNEWKNIKPAY